MISAIRKIASAAALGALALQPGIAAAQQSSCVTEAEMSAAAIYAMPSAVQSVRLRCASQLASSGFLQRDGDRFSARYAALQNRVWPRAKAGFLKFLASDRDAAQELQIFESLPDNAVRPLVDALIVQELSAKITPDNCGQVERVMQTIAPIDPEVAAGLVAAVTGLVSSDIAVCPVPRP